MDAHEIIREGILLKERPLRQRCATCGEFLTLCIYRYMGKNNRKVVRCKKCGTASWLDKDEDIRKPQKPLNISELLEARKKKRTMQNQ